MGGCHGSSNSNYVDCQSEASSPPRWRLTYRASLPATLRFLRSNRENFGLGPWTDTFDCGVRTGVWTPIDGSTPLPRPSTDVGVLTGPIKEIPMSKEEDNKTVV